jgi:hypothetical protein
VLVDDEADPVSWAKVVCELVDGADGTKLALLVDQEGEVDGAALSSEVDGG